MYEIPKILFYVLLVLPFVFFFVGLIVGIHDGKIWGYRAAQDDLEKLVDKTRSMR